MAAGPARINLGQEAPPGIGQRRTRSGPHARTRYEYSFNDDEGQCRIRATAPLGEDWNDTALTIGVDRLGIESVWGWMWSKELACVMGVWGATASTPRSCSWPSPARCRACSARRNGAGQAREERRANRNIEAMITNDIVGSPRGDFGQHDPMLLQRAAEMRDKRRTRLPHDG